MSGPSTPIRERDTEWTQALARQELAAAVIIALHQLLAAAGLDSGEVGRRAEDCIRAIRGCVVETDAPLRILFAPAAVLVQGRPLRAPRWVHEFASELGTWLAGFGAAEITIDGPVQRSDVMALLQAARHPLQSPEPPTAGALRWRGVADQALVRGIEMQDVEPPQDAIRAYATAVILNRRLLQATSREASLVESRSREICLILASIPLGASRVLLNVRARRLGCASREERSVWTALLASSMMQRLTDVRTEWLRVALVALLYDLAGEGNTLAAASRKGPDVAYRSALRLQSLLRTDPSSVAMSVVMFEAQWLSVGNDQGPLNKLRHPPSMQARVVRTARLMAERSAAAHLSDAGAIPLAFALEAEAKNDEDRTAAVIARSVLRREVRVSRRPPMDSIPPPSSRPSSGLFSAHRDSIPPSSHSSPEQVPEAEPAPQFSEDTVSGIVDDLLDKEEP
jgi:hypothetical protein